MTWTSKATPCRLVVSKRGGKERGRKGLRQLQKKKKARGHSHVNAEMLFVLLFCPREKERKSNQKNASFWLIGGSGAVAAIDFLLFLSFRCCCCLLSFTVPFFFGACSLPCLYAALFFFCVCVWGAFSSSTLPLPLSFPLSVFFLLFRGGQCCGDESAFFFLLLSLLFLCGPLYGLHVQGKGERKEKE
jgi:hypothetical protein